MNKKEKVVSDEEIITELLEALADEKAEKNVIYALAQIGIPALPFIRELLQDELVSTRLLAVKILGKMGKIAILDLIKATEDKNSAVRYEVVRYLGRLERHAIDTLDVLRKLKKDENQGVREKTYWAIGRIRRSYQDYQITTVLSQAYSKYLANEITFIEFAEIVGNYGRNGKYLLDKIFDMKDEDLLDVYLKLFDYVVKKKAFTLSEDVLKNSRRQRVKINFYKRFARNYGYYSLHPSYKYMNYQKSKNFIKCMKLLKKGDTQELIDFYSKEINEESYKNTIIFVKVIAFLDKNNKFDQLLQFFDEHYYIYGSDLKSSQLANLKEYVQIQIDYFNAY